MIIGEYIRQTDIDAYNKLMQTDEKDIDKEKKEIKLGDSIENLMKSDSYYRKGRRIKQRG
ncbi:hypothetical protein NE686_02130 [Tissierella carlieri]|uniref:Uncharacterized protein n=1 Tax=Tissierella carlieri TaxID=689904 RepID=A0ABT1S776_9FIRM|nr:hypothetical protein [Tissierella carlieri]MCQ4921872.1 hypothetical protein [Tissierella carlieri]